MKLNITLKSKKYRLKLKKNTAKKSNLKSRKKGLKSRKNKLHKRNLRGGEYIKSEGVKVELINKIMGSITEENNQMKLIHIINNSFEKYHRLTGEELRKKIHLNIPFKKSKEFSIEWFFNKIKKNKIKNGKSFQTDLADDLFKIVSKINKYNINVLKNGDESILVLDSRILLSMLYNNIGYAIGTIIKTFVFPIPKYDKDIVFIEDFNATEIKKLAYTFILQDVLNHIKISVSLDENTIREIKSIEILEDPKEHSRSHSISHSRSHSINKTPEKKTTPKIVTQASISKSRKRTPLIQKWQQKLQHKFIGKASQITADQVNAILAQERNAGNITRRGPRRGHGRGLN